MTGFFKVKFRRRLNEFFNSWVNTRVSGQYFLISELRMFDAFKDLLSENSFSLKQHTFFFFFLQILIQKQSLLIENKISTRGFSKFSNQFYSDKTYPNRIKILCIPIKKRGRRSTTDKRLYIKLTRRLSHLMRHLSLSL